MRGMERGSFLLCLWHGTLVLKPTLWTGRIGSIASASRRLIEMSSEFVLYILMP